MSYTDPLFGVSLMHPPEWARTARSDSASAVRFEGADGFVVLLGAGGPGLDGTATSHANHKLRPFGANPYIVAFRVDGQEGRLVLPSELPSDDRPTARQLEAELLIASPQPIRIGEDAYPYLMLVADLDHILTIVRTLRFMAPQADCAGAGPSETRLAEAPARVKLSC